MTIELTRTDPRTFTFRATDRGQRFHGNVVVDRIGAIGWVPGVLATTPDAVERAVSRAVYEATDPRAPLAVGASVIS